MKKIQFFIDYNFILYTLKRTNSIWSYLMIIDLTFNRKDYYNRFKKGISVNRQVIKRLNIKTIALKRHLKRVPNEEAIERLQSYKEWKENQEYIDQQISKMLTANE